MARVFHGVEMVAVNEKFIEAVYRRQEFIQVAKVILAELSRGVAHPFERRCDRGRLIGNADGRTRLAYRRKTSTDRKLTCYEVCPSCRAARFGIIVGEAHTFCGHPGQG